MCIETTRLIQRSCHSETPDSSVCTSRQADCYHDQLSTMLAQESVDAYLCVDYLNLLNPLSGEGENENCTPIDVSCRVKMTQWCYHLVDYSNFKRSTVSVAMSLLDRYLSAFSACPCAQQAIECRKTFQLACMSTLFMAMKMNEDTDFDSRHLSSLSREAYTAQDILDMERQILHTLKWRLNAPVALDFLKYLMSVLPSFQDERQRRICLSDDTLSSIFDLCAFQIEVAVGDYYFVTQKQSTIAIASFLNVLEANANIFCCDTEDDLMMLSGNNHFIINSLLEEIRFFTNVNIFTIEMDDARQRLNQLLYANDITSLSMEDSGSRCLFQSDQTLDDPTSATKPSNEEGKTSSTRTPSPICVSRMSKRKAESINPIRKVGILKSTSFQDILRSFRRS